jgi:antitoxin component of MazEF toxin-antitoxin module
MTRRKNDENYIRNLTKISGGSSYAVTIPIEYIKKLNWRAKQKLDVKLYQDRIIIRDWKE